MSGTITRKQEDILRLLSSNCHIGTQNLNFQMNRYVSHRSHNKVHILNLEETWQKIKLAARIIAAVENPADVIVTSSRLFGQRAVYKYSQATGAISTTSARWTPGTLTNQNTKKFQEPRLLIVTDPRVDKQAVIEASYVNIPTIALCDSDSPVEFVDVVIPCSNRTTQSISMIYWMLAREVKILRGELKKDAEWDLLVDLFYYRNVEDEMRKELEMEGLNDDEENPEEEEGGDKPANNQDEEEVW